MSEFPSEIYYLLARACTPSQHRTMDSVINARATRGVKVHGTRAAAAATAALQATRNACITTVVEPSLRHKYTDEGRMPPCRCGQMIMWPRALEEGGGERHYHPAADLRVAFSANDRETTTATVRKRHAPGPRLSARWLCSEGFSISFHRRASAARRHHQPALVL